MCLMLPGGSRAALNKSWLPELVDLTCHVMHVQVNTVLPQSMLHMQGCRRLT